jgi:hypothetical protein
MSTVETRTVESHRRLGEMIEVWSGPYRGLWLVVSSVIHDQCSPRGSRDAVRIPGPVRGGWYD